MNCEKFQSVASELARNEIIDAGERLSAMAHIDECKHCVRTWDDQRQLSAGLRILSEQIKSLQAPVQLEAGLRATFRERAAFAPGNLYLNSAAIWLRQSRQLC
jgi:hypothetical protein